MGARTSKMYANEELDNEDLPSESNDDLSSEGTAAVSSPASRGRVNTIIIFDWDDTLFCSTAISLHQWSKQQIEDLAKAVESVIRTARGLGETWIVTNGNATWVQDSARRFMPQLLPLLSELTVVSARALYEPTYPGNPFMWKKAAFKNLLFENRPVPSKLGLNLIALGDQLPEIEAAQHVGQLIGDSSLVKTVKFKEAPTVPELIGQLARAELDLSSIVLEQTNKHQSLLRQAKFVNQYQLESMASSWRCIVKDQWSLCKKLGFKDVWPLFS